MKVKEISSRQVGGRWRRAAGFEEDRGRQDGERQIKCTFGRQSPLQSMKEIKKFKTIQQWFSNILRKLKRRRINTKLRKARKWNKNNTPVTGH